MKKPLVRRVLKPFFDWFWVPDPTLTQNSYTHFLPIFFLPKFILNTFFSSRIVTCKICNYSAYKQSEHCKASNHFIKVVKAKKRFFECKSCKYRTYSFDKLPKHACSKCQSSSWIRTGMMRERKGPLLGNFINCLINLLLIV